MIYVYQEAAKQTQPLDFLTKEVFIICPCETSIRVAGVVEDSIVDGPGNRLTVFVQGCLRNCPGCHNPQAQPLDGGRDVYVDDLVAIIKQNPLLTGLTISGGEPMGQPCGCKMLAASAKALGLNVWVYTGFTFEEIITENHSPRIAFLKEIDVLVDGAYDEKKRNLTLPFRGSGNQRIIDVPASLKAGRAVLLNEYR